MVPFAPARFSTTTGCFRFSLSFWPITRDRMSVPPPGGYGDTMRTVPDGNPVCAHRFADDAMPRTAAQIAANDAGCMMVQSSVTGEAVTHERVAEESGSRTHTEL